MARLNYIIRMHQDLDHPILEIFIITVLALIDLSLLLISLLDFVTLDKILA